MAEGGGQESRDIPDLEGQIQHLSINSQHVEESASPSSDAMVPAGTTNIFESYFISKMCG